MKKLSAIILCISLALLSIGCQSNKTRVAEGAVIGGIIGAGAGGIIGHQMHRGAEGAGIGAAVGVLAGSIAGSQMEKNPNQAATLPSAAQAANPNQMSIQQIAELTKQGANEAVIIDKIKLTNSRYNLTEADISYLKGQGVSQKVIDTMQGKP